jgi:hypothetical protein
VNDGETIVYLVCPEHALFVGTGFLIFSLMFYYDDVDE